MINFLTPRKSYEGCLEVRNFRNSRLTSYRLDVRYCTPRHCLVCIMSDVDVCLTRTLCNPDLNGFIHSGTIISALLETLGKNAPCEKPENSLKAVLSLVY